MTLIRTVVALLGLLLSSTAFAVDFVWATQAVEATRFVDKDSAVVGKADVGKRLEVLGRKGERVRVRIDGGKFGWVDAASVSDSDPDAAAPSEDSAE